jgi:pimeloyl-ACP methyl ester carboxylesterase
MRLHYVTLGSGPPLIILHGLFGSGDNWQRVAGRLAAKHEVFLLDQRNHGLSPHTTLMDYSMMAEDVAEFMRDHGQNHATLLGHSMGGKTAMQLALDHPELVERLIVVDIAPRAYSATHREILDALLSLDPTVFANRQQMEAALAPAIPDLGVRRFLLKSVARRADGKFEWKLNLPALSNNYSALGQGVSGTRPFAGPALFVAGEKSKYIRESDWTAIRQLFPRAEGKTVGGAGHWVHADAPDAFLKTVEEFLN